MTGDGSGGVDQPKRSIEGVAPVPSEVEREGLPGGVGEALTDPEQERYLREGGTLDLFPVDFPAGTEAGVAWTFMKREAMSRALWDNGPASIVPVTRIRADGPPRHFHPGEDDHEEPHQSRAIAKLGPLGYSLLRGQLSIIDHLYERFSILRSTYDDQIAGVIGARAEGIDPPDLVYKKKARLIFWDAIGLLHVVSEQFAALYSCLKSWDGKGDLGELMVRAEVQAWKVIQSEDFGSREEWARLLGIPGADEAREGLAPDQVKLLNFLQKSTLQVLMINVTSLRRVWSRDLHRVATRYKHSYPILDSGFGHVWLGNDQAETRRLVENGALVVLDTTAKGEIDELIVPVSIGGIDVLFEAILYALRVGEILVNIALSGAEHPTGRVFVVHRRVLESGKVPLEQLNELIAAYTGAPPISPEELEGQLHKRGDAARIAMAAQRLRGRLTTGYGGEIQASPIKGDSDLP